MRFGYTQIVDDDVIRLAKVDVIYIMREQAKEELRREIEARSLTPLFGSFKEYVVSGTQRTKEFNEFDVRDPENCDPGNDDCVRHKMGYEMESLEVAWP